MSESKTILLQLKISPELNKRLGLLTVRLDKPSKARYAIELLTKSIVEEEKQNEEVK